MTINGQYTDSDNPFLLLNNNLFLQILLQDKWCIDGKYRMYVARHEMNGNTR
jgi:hypothetical protein